MTQKQIILSKLRGADAWIPSWDLEKVETQWGWIGTSGGRRCRELAEEGKIERKVEGKYVYYRTKTIKYQTYKVEGMDKIIKLPI